jgi:acyl-CoA synthetase (NDP forming)
VASLSGGMAGIVADACQEQGVVLAKFTRETHERIAAQLPGVANLDNPLDVTGQVVNEPECWTNSVQALAGDPGVDVLMSVLSITANATERRFAQDLVDLSTSSTVLPITIWPSGMPAGSGFDVLKEAGLPVHLRVEDAVLAVAAWRRYWSSRQHRLRALEIARERATGLALAKDFGSAWALLEEADISIARHAVLSDRQEIVTALDHLRLPVALKIQASMLAHKTEIGGLRLGLRNMGDVLAAWDSLADVAIRNLPPGERWAMILQEMHAGKRELILGLKHEPRLGLAIMIGLGGIFSEVLKDFAVRVAPLSTLDAEEMLGELRGKALLQEVRGLGAVQHGLLSDLLLKLSDLAVRHADTIQELDINPMIIRDDGQAVVAVDVLVKRAA